MDSMPHLHVYQVLLLHQDRQPGHLEVKIYYFYRLQQEFIMSCLVPQTTFKSDGDPVL